jgi:integrase
VFYWGKVGVKREQKYRLSQPPSRYILGDKLMQFHDLNSKASKGSVQIKASNGRLQLVFSYAGKRHYLSLGFSDTKTHRKLAEAKARQLELDMLSGHFDQTLERYKPQVALSVATPEIPLKVPPKISLADLWEGFVEYKRPQCSENTMYYVYQHFTTYMKKLPTHDLNEAGQIRDFAVQTFPLESCKRFIVRLNACCDWAKKAKLIDENPFTGMAKEIKPPKSQRKTEEDDINPFSVEERDRILIAISQDTFRNKHSGFKHSFYAPYVEFMFITGCRPSEAIRALHRLRQRSPVATHQQRLQSNFF